jgi:alpha-1,3-rhamnosyltransferase
MTKELTSFLIPSYNHANYIRECLKSILDNNIKNLELLICDDASTDGSSEIIDEWVHINKKRFYHCDFIRHQKNQGITSTLNELITVSEGVVISGVASDDYVLPGGIKSKTDYMLCNKKLLGAFSDGLAIGINGQLYSESILQSSAISVDDLNEHNIRDTVLNKWIEPMNLQFWRRSAFKCHGGEFEFDRSVYCEDLNFAMWALSRNSFGYLNKKCVAYRCKHWPTSLTPKSHDSTKKMYRDFSICYSKYSSLYEPYYRKKCLLRSFYFKSQSENKRLSYKWFRFLLENFDKSTTTKFYLLQKKMVNHFISYIKNISNNIFLAIF